jgi:hypothetical protein
MDRCDVYLHSRAVLDPAGVQPLRQHWTGLGTAKDQGERCPVWRRRGRAKIDSIQDQGDLRSAFNPHGAPDIASELVRGQLQVGWIVHAAVLHNIWLSLAGGLAGDNCALADV